MKEVFLGGTCNGSKWREELIPNLKIKYFNPVIDNWTSQHIAIEIEKRKSCDYCLYVITKEMTGVYSIAEVIDDSNKRPDKTIFAFKKEGFDNHQIKSLNQVGSMVEINGGHFMDFEDIADFLNNA